VISTVFRRIVYVLDAEILQLDRVLHTSVALRRSSGL
jgi:hypothetical protein